MDVSKPNWATSDETTTKAADVENSGVSFASSMSAAAMEMSATSSEVAPSSERTSLHRMYRFFKFIAVLMSLLLLIAQVVSVVYLPFDMVELALKVFLSSFSVLVILNELEWWGMLRDSPMFWNFIPRGYFYAFIGLVSTEENDVKPTSSASSINSLTIDYSAALFIETASWMMVSVGIIYVLAGLFCGQHYLNKVRDDHSNRVAERKKMFEEGINSSTALSNQMIT